jgi:autotransporter-associated beta strand protein
MHLHALRTRYPFESCRKKALLAVFLAALATVGALAATPTYYWDTNGSDDGPGNPPSDLWAWNTPTWTSDSYGTSATFTYPVRANIVFAATGDAFWDQTYDYTVSIDGVAQISNVYFKDGNATLTNNFGYLDKDTPYIWVGNYGQTATVYSPIASKSGTSSGITKYGYGTLLMAGTNTYAGPTTVEGGILRLGAPQVLPRTSQIVLAGGDIRTSDPLGLYGYSTTPPTFDTGGYSQTLGPLALTGPYTNLTHRLDLGNGASALAFADSHTQDWHGIPLYILNYKLGVDSLRFGTNSSGLTPAQLSLIQFQFPTETTYVLFVPAKIDAKGYVIPTSPPIQSVTMLSSTESVVTWSAVKDRRYILHYKNRLSDSVWSDAGQAVTAPGRTASLTNSAALDAAHYYYVQPLPDQPPS